MDGGTEPSPVRQAARPGRYGLLLAVLVSSYLLSSFASGPWVAALEVVLFAIATLQALRSAALPRRVMWLTTLILIVGSGVMTGLALGTRLDAGISYVWVAAVLLAGAIMIVHRVLAFGAVTLQSLFGAVSAYLILGLMFAAVFAAIGHLGGGHFFANGEQANTKTFQYFSFTTLTTLGYGDFTAAGNDGRSIAVLEALTGQVFLATLVARLVAAFRGPAEQRADRGRERPPPG